MAVTQQDSYQVIDQTMRDSALQAESAKSAIRQVEGQKLALRAGESGQSLFDMSNVVSSSPQSDRSHDTVNEGIVLDAVGGPVLQMAGMVKDFLGSDPFGEKASFDNLISANTREIRTPPMSTGGELLGRSELVGEFNKNSDTNSSQFAALDQTIATLTGEVQECMMTLGHANQMRMTKGFEQYHGIQPGGPGGGLAARQMTKGMQPKGPTQDINSEIAKRMNEDDTTAWA